MPQRGTFTFPAPYGTTGIRLTNAGDCGGGDCVNYVGYSYWSNINNHVGSDTMLIVPRPRSAARRRRADAFQLQQEHRRDAEPGTAVFCRQPVLVGVGRRAGISAPAGATRCISTTANRLLRYDVVRKAIETVFDVREHLGRRQAHLADALEQRRSRALGDGEGRELRRMIGCVAYSEDHAARRLHRGAKATSTSARSTRAAAGW